MSGTQYFKYARTWYPWGTHPTDGWTWAGSNIGSLEVGRIWRCLWGNKDRTHCCVQGIIISMLRSAPAIKADCDIIEADVPSTYNWFWKPHLTCSNNQVMSSMEPHSSEEKCVWKLCHSFKWHSWQRDPYHPIMLTVLLTLCAACPVIMDYNH